MAVSNTILGNFTSERDNFFASSPYVSVVIIVSLILTLSGCRDFVFRERVKAYLDNSDSINSKFAEAIKSLDSEPTEDAILAAQKIIMNAYEKQAGLLPPDGLEQYQQLTLKYYLCLRDLYQKPGTYTYKKKPHLMDLVMAAELAERLLLEATQAKRGADIARAAYIEKNKNRLGLK